jgi:hypothetical protein
MLKVCGMSQANGDDGGVVVVVVVDDGCDNSDDDGDTGYQLCSFS